MSMVTHGILYRLVYNGGMKPDDLETQAVYDHYKGGKYTVLFVGYESTNARTPGRIVVYVSHTYGQVKCRDFEEFIEEVEWPDGTLQPRFIISKK